MRVVATWVWPWAAVKMFEPWVYATVCEAHAALQRRECAAHKFHLANFCQRILTNSKWPSLAPFFLNSFRLLFPVIRRLHNH